MFVGAREGDAYLYRIISETVLTIALPLTIRVGVGTFCVRREKHPYYHTGLILVLPLSMDSETDCNPGAEYRTQPYAR
jgi:hypothetical protein